MARMMASLNPTISKFDESFSAEKSSQYRMAIQFTLDGLSYALYDQNANSIIGMESHQTDSDNSDVFQLLEQLLDEKGLNNKSFQSVTCIIDNRMNTLVPTSLFRETNLNNYLDFTSQVPETHSISAERLEPTMCHNVYATHKTLKNKILKKWSKANIVHSGSVFINGAMATNAEQGVFVHVRNRDFDMLIKKEGKLLFYNNFRFNTKEDFAYFLLFAMEQNQMSGLAVPVTLSGLILPSSDIVAMCGRYIKQIRIVEEEPQKLLKGVPFQYYWIHYQALR